MATIFDMFRSSVAGTEIVAPSTVAMATDKQRFFVVKLLNSKLFNEAEIAVPANGRTFGDLATTVARAKADGSAGRHFPKVWELDADQIKPVIDRLISCPDRGKPSGNFKPKASAPAATPVAPQQDLKAMVAEAVASTIAAMMAAEVAPQPVADHIVVPQPAPPVVEEVTISDLPVGAVIRITKDDGTTVIRQIVDRPSGVGLNATIA